MIVPASKRSQLKPPPLWPWLAFALAAAWIVLSRIPLILNSANHLDSDLAVDGLTLLQATRGKFLWHYPGTPYMGAGTVLLSLPQAWIWGANPWTLVSGGTVAFLGLVLATFLLAWRAFGTTVALFSLVPLAFGSTGAVWLSGRITGGHLIAALFHAGLFFGFVSLSQAETSRKRLALALGLWGGVGLYLDSMFALSLLGFGIAAIGVFLGSKTKRMAVPLVLCFTSGFFIGVAPREIGARVDPYSAYDSQFQVVWVPELLVEHSRILGLDCLPRLFAGHRLPGLETEPDPQALSGPASSRSRARIEPLGLAVTALAIGLAFASFLALAVQVFFKERWLAFGLLVSAVAAIVAFITNRNIFNSDNYRYLVTLLVPLAIGSGILLSRLWERGGTPRALAIGLATTFAILMTMDLKRWYHEFGWVDQRGLPIAARFDDPTLNWLNQHPEIDRIEGGYWDVYRLIYLSGGRLKGTPFPIYPNRYPSWKPLDGEKTVLIGRSTPESKPFVDQAIERGANVRQRSRGISILSLP